jgi:clan AA aspartic protease (TIGR02281 family)
MPKVRLEIPLSLPIRIFGPAASKDVEALIDTGATYMVVSREDAVRIGYEPWKAPTAAVGTGAGLIDAPLISLDRVEILGLSRRRVKAIVKDLTDVGIAAGVGWSFLRHFRMTFDPKRRTFEIT